MNKQTNKQTQTQTNKQTKSLRGEQPPPSTCKDRLGKCVGYGCLFVFVFVSLFLCVFVCVFVCLFDCWCVCLCVCCCLLVRVACWETMRQQRRATQPRTLQALPREVAGPVLRDTSTAQCLPFVGDFDFELVESS